MSVMTREAALEAFEAQLAGAVYEEVDRGAVPVLVLASSGMYESARNFHATRFARSVGGLTYLVVFEDGMAATVAQFQEDGGEV
jgi:hypothetical protein